MKAFIATAVLATVLAISPAFALKLGDEILTHVGCNTVDDARKLDALYEADDNEGASAFIARPDTSCGYVEGVPVIVIDIIDESGEYGIYQIISATGGTGYDVRRIVR